MLLHLLVGCSLLLACVLGQYEDQPTFLEVQQVQQPPVVGVPSTACNVTLMQHIFANSYGQPFIGQYDGPPIDCPGPWSHVLLNLSVVSQGVQFDRLGLIWLGDVLIWETSTAEPTAGGIHFEYWKETQAFSKLWERPQQIIVDIGNIVNDIYTGSFNATMTAIFIQGEREERAADLIIPIAKGPGQLWSVPDDDATVSTSIPANNVEKAVLQVFASGNGNEEFWYSNTLNEYVDIFAQNGTQLLGEGPFREVQVSIDGRIAGVAWPFPIVYTGGLVPGLWRPIVGIDAFDVPSYEIGLDPWLGLLSDGHSHTFSLQVVGMPTTLENWFVSANIKLWTSRSGGMTTGEITHYSVDAMPRIYSKAQVGSGNTSLSTLVTTSRELTITSRVRLPSAPKSEQVSWKQSLSYTNAQTFVDGGNTQTVVQQTIGQNSDRNGVLFSYSYPLSVNTTYAIIDKNGSFEITGTVDRGYRWTASDWRFSPNDVTGTVNTHQVGDAFYIANATTHKSTSSGTTMQRLDFESDGNVTGVESYVRQVSASGGHIVSDQETLNGVRLGQKWLDNQERVLLLEQNQGIDDEFAEAPLEDVLGRKRAH